MSYFSNFLQPFHSLFRQIVKMTDADLIAQIKCGNTNAFRFLVSKYQRLVWHMVLRMVRQQEDAEDICQEVFIRVFRNINGYRGDSKLSTWKLNCPDMETKLLNNESVDTIHSAFVEAFSDYTVNIGMTLAKFKEFFLCRDINLDYSVGLYDGKLIGFILNGYRIIDGQRYCYDGGTGFLPSYRNQGLGSKLLQQMIMMLGERGIQHYVLEVLEDNIPAQKLYEKYGFHISRHLLCFKAQREAMAELNLVDKNIRLTEINGRQLRNYTT